jgi:hypothetical protein
MCLLKKLQFPFQNASLARRWTSHSFLDPNAVAFEIISLSNFRIFWKVPNWAIFAFLQRGSLPKLSKLSYFRIFCKTPMIWEISLWFELRLFMQIMNIFNDLRISNDSRKKFSCEQWIFQWFEKLLYDSRKDFLCK